MAVTPLKPFRSALPSWWGLRSRPRRGAIATFAIGALTAFAGCTSDEVAPPPREPSAIVELRFEEVTYVDPAISTRKLVDRVRHQTRSVFRALRKADVTVTMRKQVEVDLAHLDREPVTVVDPATGQTRPGLRLRYHFSGLAVVPQVLSGAAGMKLAVLHSVDPAKSDAVASTCAAPNALDGATGNEIWNAFDSSLPSCSDAVQKEQDDIDQARSALTAPGKQVVPSEFDRLYVPVVVHIDRRQRKTAAPRAKAKSPPTVEVQPPADPALVPPSDPARSPPKAPQTAGMDDDEAELRQSFPRGAAIGNAQEVGGAGQYLQPNYALLYFVAAAGVVLVVGKQQQNKRRRR